MYNVLDARRSHINAVSFNFRSLEGCKTCQVIACDGHEVPIVRADRREECTEGGGLRSVEPKRLFHTSWSSTFPCHHKHSKPRMITKVWEPCHSAK